MATQLLYTALVLLYCFLPRISLHKFLKVVYFCLNNIPGKEPNTYCTVLLDYLLLELSLMINCFPPRCHQ